MVKIKFTEIGHPENFHEYQVEKITIGRSDVCQFIINDPHVSRLHAEIIYIPEQGYVLRNLSKQPVFINDVVTDRHLLQNNDHIKIGSHSFSVQLEPDLGSMETLAHLPITNPHTTETIVEPLKALLVVTQGPQPGNTLIINKPKVIVGRADDCDLTLDDGRVSREHFAIEQRENSHYLIRLSTKVPVTLNHVEVQEQKLYNEDEIGAYPFTLQFQSTLLSDQRIRPTGKPEPSNSNVFNGEERTVHVRLAAKKELGPHIIVQSENGENQSHALNEGRTVLGRSNSCTVPVTGDPSISREHIAIDKIDHKHYIVALSRSPILLNGTKTAKARIYSGDTIQIGNTLLNFISDRKEDERPRKETIVVTRKGAPRALLLIISVIALGMAGYLLLKNIWHPWQINKHLTTAASHLESGELQQAYDLLQTLYEQDLTHNSQQKAASLLAAVTSALTNKHISDGNLETAKKKLIDFLKQHGTEAASTELWQQLNEIRFTLGNEYMHNNRDKLALREYLSIDSDSSFYPGAQKTISEIWLKTEKQAISEAQQEQESIHSLLFKAEQLFQQKHYLTPINNNAYNLYIQVLERKPDHAIAKNRIESMKRFYQRLGEKLCKEGNTDRARTYYQRYLIIEPDNEQIRKQMSTLNQCIKPQAVLPTPLSIPDTDKPAQQPEQPLQQAVDQAKRQEKVKKLLEQEGVESNWIVDYLFNESEQSAADDNQDDTPW